MKRKKWSEQEEQTLLSKYSSLLSSGSLSKLNTREKKFGPIADHLNSLHHHLDPTTFPFSWSWRDVSIKLHNMRHQYLNVKHKIRLSPHRFNWPDGPLHWQNFLKYKQVFGDIHLSSSSSDDEDEDTEIRKLGDQVLELQDVILRREETRREREWGEEVRAMEAREAEVMKRADEREEGVYEEEEVRMELGMRREFEMRVRLERELRRERMRMQERLEEGEMEWRERMVEMQMQHEKQMMRMHADACQNQMQILGVVARLVCQIFGSGSDGLGGGMGGLAAPQGLQHSGGLGDGGGKAGDATSPSEFL